MDEFSKGPWAISEYESQVLDADGKTILEASIFSKYEDKDKYKNNVRLASLSYEMLMLLRQVYSNENNDVLFENDIYNKIEEILEKIK